MALAWQTWRRRSAAAGRSRRRRLQSVVVLTWNPVRPSRQPRSFRRCAAAAARAAGMCRALRSAQRGWSGSGLRQTSLQPVPLGLAERAPLVRPPGRGSRPPLRRCTVSVFSAASKDARRRRRCAAGAMRAIASVLRSRVAPRVPAQRSADDGEHDCQQQHLRQNVRALHWLGGKGCALDGRRDGPERGLLCGSQRVVSRSR